MQQHGNLRQRPASRRIDRLRLGQVSSQIIQVVRLTPIAAGEIQSSLASRAAILRRVALTIGYRRVHRAGFRRSECTGFAGVRHPQLHQQPEDNDKNGEKLLHGAVRAQFQCVDCRWQQKFRYF